MPDAPIILPLIECDDAALCGGKAINLGRLLRADIPAPDGFVITTTAHRLARQIGGELPESVAEKIVDAYRQFGSPAVVVRSSATAEDLSEASMAGQYATFLDVSDENALLAAVQQCWRSIDSARLQTYLAEHGIEAESVAMAVVVQRLVPADVAGVLFTTNPRTADPSEMLIEAAWGLGEAVVSGSVQPDLVVVDRDSGREKEYTIADKAIWLEPGAGQQRPVDTDRRNVRCLAVAEVRDLWELGRRVADEFGAEQDMEWAICSGQPQLLQSRPITTLTGTDAYRNCIEGARRYLQQRKAAGRGDWVRHNVAETLPHPSPLTWSVVRQFMSGGGGFGRLYRSIGFEPSEQVCRDGFLELIAGRIYSDLSLAPEMYFEEFPFRYDPDLLRCRPDASQQPPTIPAGSWRKRIQITARLARIEQRLLNLAADCDRQLGEATIPRFIAWVAGEKRRNLAALSAGEWGEVWNERKRRVLDHFAAECLLPSMIVAMGLERLGSFLKEHFWDESPADLLNVLAVGDRADSTIEFNESLRKVATGEDRLERWLADYGHRGPDEFDLGAPRWREQPDAVRGLAAMLADRESPLLVHERRLTEAHQCAATLREKLPRRFQVIFDERLSVVRRYLPWREDGKAALMLGYDLLRDLALDAGRRLDVVDDVFLLTQDEVQKALVADDVPQGIIRDRRLRRAAEKRLSLPLYIGTDEIEKFGQRLEVTGRPSYTAVPISTGSATGSVRVVRSPREAVNLGRGYVLVCPSTDPSWTPLFVDAAALVLECGGMLSHGAIVAREMGIPAVVLPEATRLLKDDELVSIDGQHGVIVREDAARERRQQAVNDPNDVRIAPDRIPPVRGLQERRAAKLQVACFLIWGLYLAAVLLLPSSWCYDPSLRLLDTLFWPLVATLGKPATVAVLAVTVALLATISQRMLTDNRRLLVAKRRANRLRREAERLPLDSPRRAALTRAASVVQSRLLGASLVPVAMLLGPMVMSFVWLSERIDPASWNPPPGATVHVVAEIDGEYVGEIRLQTDTALRLDAQTPAVQATQPVRAVLTNLLAEWEEAAPTGDESPGEIPPALVEDLQEYLDRRLPPREITWTLRTPPEPDRYPIALVAGDGTRPVRTSLVLGDRFPPEPKTDLGDGRGPLQTVRTQAGTPIQRVTVTYQFPRTRGNSVFFAPLKSIPLQVLDDRGWSNWDAGWLLTYIAAYLAVLLPMRWLLRIP